MPSLRLPNLRPTQAIARPGQLIIPNRLQIQRFNMTVGDSGLDDGYKLNSFGSLSPTQLRGWSIDEIKTDAVNLVDVHNPDNEQFNGNLTLYIIYQETTLGSTPRIVALPWDGGQFTYQVTDLLLANEIRAHNVSGEPFGFTLTEVQP